MAKVTLEGVRKVFESNVVAVDDFNLEIEDGEFLVLVGPSGCGKSTTLRMVAGLEEITAGTIRIGDRVVNDVPPKDRDIAMVFQNYALYPHMTVYDNMAFGLKLRRFPRAEIDKKVRDAAQILGLEPLLKRRPKALSGGQRQRVAMGRAIVRAPKVFLFDEPLSNLDAKLRVEMRKEILQLHRQMKTTIIYVTHDQIEAMTLGDRICVMKDGLIQQVGEPTYLFDHPANLFVARFIGTPPMNILDGDLEQRDGTLLFRSEALTAALPERMRPRIQSLIGKPVCLGIRPRSFAVSGSEPDPDPGRNRFRGTVELTELLGEELLIHLRCGKNTFIASLDPHVRAEVGREFEVLPDLDRAHIFDAESEQNLTTA